MANDGGLPGRIIKLIQSRGGVAVKYNPLPFGTAGTGDILGCYKGRALHIEAKKPGKEPSPLQRARIDKWRNAGAASGWCNHIDGVIMMLNGIDLGATGPFAGDWGRFEL